MDDMMMAKGIMIGLYLSVGPHVRESVAKAVEDAMRGIGEK